MRRFLYIILLMVLASGLQFPAIEAATKPKAKKTQSAEEVLKKAVDSFYNYDFDEADDLLEEYKSLKAKAKQQPDDEAVELESMLEVASSAFDRVQKIVVIDSINMPRATFFKAYKLAESAGKTGLVKDFKLKDFSGNNEVSFINEGGDYLITVEAEDEELRLKENYHLLDGSWEKRDILGEEFEKNGDYAFPFMSGDGQTLYFANNGEDSMGGFDLFVVQKEPITGAVLQPLNLGMPFNSPYDDFLMAIDEETGVGWWATDRNDPGGDVTVYVYILEEVRKNYPSDTDNLIGFAKLSNYKSTWEEGKENDYKKILNSLPR